MQTPLRGRKPSISLPDPPFEIANQMLFTKPNMPLVNYHFTFLSAQLDFLAKFFTPPYIGTKNRILSDSSSVHYLPLFDNYLLFMGILIDFLPKN